MINKKNINYETFKKELSNFLPFFLREISYQEIDNFFSTLIGSYLANKLSSYLGTENFGILNFY